MKTIKFRALKDDVSDFRFVYGNLIYDYQDNPRIQEDKNEPTFTTCIKGTEGQFTGLHDKNGKEIFEGDILEIDNSNLEKRFSRSLAGELMKEKQLDSFIIKVEQTEFLNIKIITYLKKDNKMLTNCDYYGKEEDKSLFYEVSWDFRWLKYVEPFCEIIGNIHENPELL